MHAESETVLAAARAVLPAWVAWGGVAFVGLTSFLLPLLVGSAGVRLAARHVPGGMLGRAVVIGATVTAVLVATLVHLFSWPFAAVPRSVITAVGCLAVATSATIVLRRRGRLPDAGADGHRSPLVAARVHLLALVGALLVVLAQVTGVVILESRGGYEAELMFTGCPGKLAAVVQQHVARGDRKGALALARANSVLHPQQQWTTVELARVSALAGNRESSD